MTWDLTLWLALSLPLYYFFFLVVSADIRDGQLQYRYKARTPEIVRTLVCSVPILNIFSSARTPGQDPLSLYIALGLLSAPFAVSLRTAPSGADAERLRTFVPKWIISKIEASIYGLITLAFASIVLGYIGVADDWPKRIVNLIAPDLDVGVAVPTTVAFTVVLAGAIARGLIVAHTMRATRAPVVFGFFLVLSILGALTVWLLALAQINFEPSDWRAPIGGAVGVGIAMLCDRAFKRDLHLVAQRHGQW